MGGMNPDLMQRIQQLQNNGGMLNSGGVPGAGGMGVLSMLPPAHQQAATAPPPMPGGMSFDSLGPYSQQALTMAGANPGAPQQNLPQGVNPPGGGLPPPQIGPPSGGPGKGSPFGGGIDRGAYPGLLEHLR